MTTAARPTWAPAKGGNEARIFGSSQKYASRDLAARTTLKPRISRGKFTVAAITADDYIPMRSTEVKNRTSSSDIKSLRVITGVKTTYLPDGRFDLEAYDSLINMQIDGGAEGVIVGGTAREGHLMSWDGHIMLIGHTVNCFGTKIKVIGNTGSNSTREAVHATEQGFAVGMHAALHINPYYGKTSIEGLISHYDAVLPMGLTIIYNLPSRTGQDIPPVIEAVSGYSNRIPFVLLDLSAELVLMVRECLHMDSMFPGTKADYTWTACSLGPRPTEQGRLGRGRRRQSGRVTANSTRAQYVSGNREPICGDARG